MLLVGLAETCGVVESEEVEEPPVADLAGVTIEALPACDEPDPGWADLLPTSGVDFVHRRDPCEGLSDELYQQVHSLGAGVVTADLDGDEVADILFTSVQGPNQLWRGSGDGTFERVHGTGLELEELLTDSASAADYDGDGLLDVVLGGIDDLRLMRNLGDTTFEDVTSQVGLSTGEGLALCLSWADVDQDGDLDLYAGSLPVAPYSQMSNPGNGWDGIWLQGDDGRFEDHAGDLYRGASTDGACITAAWRDLDDDGDLDLLQLNDYGMFHNTEIWDNHGLDEDGALEWRDAMPLTGIGVLDAPMGASVVDLDDDGLLDLWLSDRETNQVFKGLGGFQFLDVGLTWRPDPGDAPGQASWSVRPIDLSGDGRTEVFLVYGPFDDIPGEPVHIPDQPNRLWRRVEGEDLYFEQSLQALPEPGAANSRGVGEADLTGDGIPDVVVGNLDDRPYIYRAGCTAGRRLAVELRDETGRNLFAIGARVTVEAGPLYLQREVAAGGQGTFSSSEPILYFGLGQNPVDRVIVRWPDGEERVIEAPCDHCRLRITR